MSAPAAELLKISELAERSGVPVATVRHYLREGLLPEPVKTSRNMAYYPPSSFSGSASSSSFRRIASCLCG